MVKYLMILSLFGGIMGMQTKRITWIDMAKGYGMLAVLIGHLVQGGLLGNFVYSFHLPLFFFLSGYLFNGSVGFGTFLKKKAKSILLPYFSLGIFIVFFSVYYPYLFEHKYHTPEMFRYMLGQHFLAFLFQYRYGTVWYLAVLLCINLMMYFIVKIPKKWIQAIVVVALMIFGLYRYLVLHGREMFWNFDAALTTSIFFWVGYVLKKNEEKLRKVLEWKYRAILVPAFLAANICFNLISFETTGKGLELWGMSYGMPVCTYLSAFFGIAMVVVLSSLFVLKPIRYIGEYSLIYFAWHQAVIYPLLDEIYKHFGHNNPWASMGDYIFILVTKILITCVVLTLVNELIQRTPLRVMVGKPLKKA